MNKEALLAKLVAYADVDEPQINLLKLYVRQAEFVALDINSDIPYKSFLGFVAKLGYQLTQLNIPLSCACTLFTEWANSFPHLTPLSPDFWKMCFINAGMPEPQFNKLVQSKKVCLASFYFVYKHATPFFYSQYDWALFCLTGQLPAVQYAITQLLQGNTAATTEDGITPIHFAYWIGGIPIINYLESTYNNAQPLPDNVRRTILHFAAWNGEPEVIKKALTYNLNPLTRTHYGQNAFDYAKTSGHPLACETLETNSNVPAGMR